RRHVERALDDVADHSLVESMAEDQPAGTKAVDLQHAEFALVEGGEVHHLDALQLAVEQLPQRQHAAAALAHGENDLRDAKLLDRAQQVLVVDATLAL